MWLATGSFAVGLLLANLGLPEYSQRLYPVGLRGATGLPWALAFNLMLFVVPGALLAIAAQRLRGHMEAAGWLARIGIALAQLSALAFALQGVLTLDLNDLDGPAGRLHALAWMLWWIAFVPAALLLALAGKRGAAFAAASLVLGLLVPLIAVVLPLGAWVGLAQRLAFALWFGWWLLAAAKLRAPAR